MHIYLLYIMLFESIIWSLLLYGYGCDLGLFSKKLVTTDVGQDLDFSESTISSHGQAYSQDWFVKK